MIKRKINIEKFNSFCIIQTAFLGDITLSLYLCQQIKNVHPSAHITFITTPSGSEIANLAQSIDEVKIFDKYNLHKSKVGRNTLIYDLNKQNFDCVISVHRSFRTSKLVSKIKSKVKIGFNTASFSPFVYDYKAPYHQAQTEIERNLSLLKYFKIESTIPDVDLQFPNEVQEKIDSLIQEQLAGNEFIVIAPGSIWETKRWKDEYFVELIELLAEFKFKFVLSGANNEKELCTKIYNQLKENTKSNCINFAGEFSIQESIYLIAKAKFVVTNDSSPTHFSNLVGTPVAVIYGPTSPIFGFAPKNASDLIIENNNLNCRPCEIHGSHQCPLGNHLCMMSIQPETVANAIVEKMIKKND